MRGSAAIEEMRGIPVSSSSLSVSTSSSDASLCRLLRRLLNDSFSSNLLAHDNRLPNEFRLSKSVSPECAAVVKERAREYGAKREERRFGAAAVGAVHLTWYTRRQLKLPPRTNDRANRLANRRVVLSFVNVQKRYSQLTRARRQRLRPQIRPRHDRSRTQRDARALIPAARRLVLDKATAVGAVAALEAVRGICMQRENCAHSPHARGFVSGTTRSTRAATALQAPAR